MTMKQMLHTQKKRKMQVHMALQLSKISESEYHMGGELNTALRILISPRYSEDLTDDEIKHIISEYFDGRRNIFAESFKFRQVKQGSAIKPSKCISRTFAKYVMEILLELYQ
ncbi:uncharacterized protein ACRADG_007142 isoform 1-T3 [Cochliomyia hominivorax]